MMMMMMMMMMIKYQIICKNSYEENLRGDDRWREIA